MADKPETPPRPPAEDETHIARRKLLRLTCYVAPAIIGTFAARDAAAATCDPQTYCNPRVEDPEDCFPKR
jgi:hypothetical protein